MTSLTLCRKLQCILTFSFSLILGSCATGSHFNLNSVPSDQSTYDYQFTWDRCGTKPCIRTALMFYNESGLTELKLPITSGQKDLYKVIQNLRVKDQAGVNVKATSWPEIFELRSRAGQWVRVEYDVIQDFEGDLDEEERFYRAVINEQFFHIFGEGLLVYPKSGTGIQRTIHLSWNLPSSFTVINSFDALKRDQEIKTSIDTLRQGTFLGGTELRTSKIEINGSPVWTAFIGKFGFQDQGFIDILNKLLTTERNFWNDHAFPYTLISAISVTKDGKSQGGQGRTNGFAVFGSETPDQVWLEQLLAHELFHTWNGHLIQKEENEDASKWFSEGFTEYYGHLSIFRAGLIDLPEYLKLFNLSLKKYSLSEAKNAPLRRVVREYWSSNTVQRLPYQQGELLAQIWNSEIKARSKNQLSLDDAMRALLKSAKEHGTVSDAKSLASVFTPFLKRNPDAQINSFIRDGNTITGFPKTLGTCVNLKTEQQDTFDLGFDRQKTRASKTATGVKMGGVAAQAGLMEGDAILATDLTWGDPDHEVVLKVKTSGGNREIRFFPRGKKVALSQYVLDYAKFAKNPQTCLEYFLK